MEGICTDFLRLTCVTSLSAPRYSRGRMTDSGGRSASLSRDQTISAEQHAAHGRPAGILFFSRNFDGTALRCLRGAQNVARLTPSPANFPTLCTQISGGNAACTFSRVFRVTHCVWPKLRFRVSVQAVQTPRPLLLLRPLSSLRSLKLPSKR